MAVEIVISSFKMADQLGNAGGLSSKSNEEAVNTDYDEELDFFSPNFNPLRALHAPAISIPHPEIKSFQSVKSYEDAIKRRQQSKTRTTSATTAAAEQQKSVQCDSTGSTSQTSRTIPKSSGEKTVATTASISASKPPSLSTIDSSKSQKEVEKEGLLLPRSDEEQYNKNVSAKSREGSKLSVSERCENQGSTGIRRQDQSAAASEASVKYKKLSSGISDKSLSSSSQDTDSKYHRVSKSLEISASCSQAPSTSESRKVDVQKSHSVDHKETSSTQIAATPEDTESSSAPTKKAAKRLKPRNVFTRMECMSGPLRLLTRCVQDHLQVRVMTRGAVCVRGICKGYIVAFDKHFNMAMIDVDEIYRRPVALGKIKSRRSHKLLAAQTTLQKEREECQAKWKEDQEVLNASSSLQDLSIKATVSLKDQQPASSSSHGQQKTLAASEASTCSQPQPLDHSISQSTSHSNQPKEETEMQQIKGLRTSQAKLQRSVYDGVKTALSSFEREALMLGIPDENVDHRHVSQMFIRGENVVSVSVVDDF